MLFKNDNYKSDELTHRYLPPKKFIIKDGIDGTAAVAKGGSFDPTLTPRSICTIPEGATLLVDFGEEISGGAKLVFHKNSGSKIRLTFGESAAEALSNTGEFGSTNDHSIRDTVLTVPSFGSLEYGKCGFRFVRIRALDGQLALIGLFARADFRALEWRGSFESSDKKLNEIWRVSARTLHLNMQDMLYDGIKRDRLVWVGDMHPEVKCALALFGETKCVKKSLDFAKNTTPKNAWMNTFPSYSLWWVMIQYDLYMHTADAEYLRESMGCILDILSRFAKCVNPDGSVSGLPNFLDWSMYDNNSAKDAAFSALAVMAFDRGAYLCRALGGEEFLAVAERLDAYKKRLASRNLWSVNKQAIAMQVLSGQKRPEDAASALSTDTAHNISVFYGYYVLLALSECGLTKHALETVKKYWGAMLELGATTFFENFELSETEGELPPLKIDTPPTEGFKNIYAEGGAHCYRGYRRSLAHGWASGPLPWISEHLLGVKVLEPGCKKVLVAPELAGLSWMKGAYPTPYGNIEISVTKSPDGPIVEITAPDEVEIVRPNEKSDNSPQ
ncbi:MAG: alpha-L-rhamnosidase [Clostridia bacterium]|nr:alpha-L-rhamnosidase [Clostridia bacterium]